MKKQLKNLPHVIFDIIFLRSIKATSQLFSTKIPKLPTKLFFLILSEYIYRNSLGRIYCSKYQIQRAWMTSTVGQGMLTKSYIMGFSSGQLKIRVPLYFLSVGMYTRWGASSSVLISPVAAEVMSIFSGALPRVPYGADRIFSLVCEISHKCDSV